MRPDPLRILAPFVAAIVAFAPASHADNDVVVAAPEARVPIEARSARLQLVNLPELEFALRAVYRCQGKPVSMTLSVSDTAKTLGPDVLAEQRAAEVNLRVPAAQVAMVNSGRFCVAGDTESADEMAVAGFATVAVSLRCDDDGVFSMHYTSAPLNVRLVCLRAPDQEPPGSPAER